MEPPSTEDALTISTESLAGRRRFALLCLLIVLGAAGTILVLHRFGTFKNPARAPLIVFGLLGGMSLWFLMVLYFKRGTWRIELEGLRYQPLHRQPRFLRWAEIEKVKFARYGRRYRIAAVRGGAIKIPTSWILIARRARHEGQQRLRAILGDDFDFTERSAFSLNRKGGAAAWAAEMFLLSLGAILYVVLALTFLAHLQERLGACASSFWGLLLLVPAYVLFVVEDLRSWRARKRPEHTQSSSP